LFFVVGSLLVLSGVAPAIAQEAPSAVSETSVKDGLGGLGKDESVATYERKSITYLEMLNHAGADDDVYAAVQAAVRANVELPRFDYNDVSRFRTLTPGDAAKLVKEYLDKVKLERAREQATEFDVRFKDTVITGEDLRRIANSAYLYQPTLSHSRVRKERFVMYQNGRPVIVQRWVANLRVDVAFYAVDFNSGTAKEMGHISAAGSGSATIGGFNSSGGARSTAIREAADSAGSQLSKDVRTIEAFNLLTPIAAAGFNSVNFGLSRKEGLKLGQGFYVYDYLTTGGRERVGYVKVMRVGDGEEVLDSEAQNITVSNGFSFEEGQLLQEHPQHGVKVLPKVGILQHRVKAPATLGVDESSMAGAFGVEVSYDIGDRLGIPEVYAAGALGLSAGSSYNLEYGLEIGLDKRFYLRRLVLTPGFRVGILRTHWSFDPTSPLLQGYENFEDASNLVGSSLGVTPRFGAEIFLTPEWSFVANAGYRLYTPQTSANLYNPDTDASFDVDGFEYNPSGLDASLGVSYTF
jgi:hypothetical protein